MSTSFSKEDIKQLHKLMAPALFNKTWDYLDKPERSLDDQMIMLASAFASWYHWKQIGGSIEDERGLWLIAKVLYVLNKHHDALVYAIKCLDICNENNITGFDLAFAYEMMARILLSLNKNEDARKYYKQAKDTGEVIKDTNDREYFFSQLEDLKELL